MYRVYTNKRPKIELLCSSCDNMSQVYPYVSREYFLTLVLLCPDIYGVKDVLDQYKYQLILIK